MTGMQLTKTVAKKQKPLTLHLKAKSSKRVRQVWRFDWNGLDEERDRIRCLTEEIEQKTNALESECKGRGLQAAGAIGCAIRNPEEAERLFSPYVCSLQIPSCTLICFSTTCFCDPSIQFHSHEPLRLAAKVGRLHLELRELHMLLIYTHGLQCDLVLKESGKILDPRRIPLWDALIEKEKKKQARFTKQ